MRGPWTDSEGAHWQARWQGAHQLGESAYPSQPPPSPPASARTPTGASLGRGSGLGRAVLGHAEGVGGVGGAGEGSGDRSWERGPGGGRASFSPFVAGELYWFRCKDLSAQMYQKGTTTRASDTSACRSWTTPSPCIPIFVRMPDTSACRSWTVVVGVCCVGPRVFASGVGVLGWVC